jgi:RES domain-containing protein
MGRAWRILKKKHLHKAWDGEAAKNHGGKWNRKGVPLIYLSSSLSLCGWEIFVHLGSQISDRRLETLFAVVPVEFPDWCVETLDFGMKAWEADHAVTQEIGENWIQQKRSLLLQVPSFVIPIESNYLLNPNHPAFEYVSIGAPEEVRIDSRLFL